MAHFKMNAWDINCFENNQTQRNSCICIGTMANIDNEFHRFAEFSFTHKRRTRLIMLESLPEKESSFCG